jgi:hypothetical protein
LLLLAAPLSAQLPFYTDDPAVTDKNKFHFEFFDEYDGLQRPQFPNLRQNTANYKLNYGLPYNLELDFDAPYLAIFRALGPLPRTSTGAGDTDLGIKWNFHKQSETSRLPGLGASLYIEFPTGDIRHQLGSGVIDYALNLIGQKKFTDKTRLTMNSGILFAGNTSTGVLGIQTTRGRVITGGTSLIHDVTSKLTLGGEVYGGFTSNLDLVRSQLQIMLGGSYAVHNGMTLDFGILGGKYSASPRVGFQLGFSLDFPSPIH